MLGNFFMLTCPYLYDLQTVTYFALLRKRHSPTLDSRNRGDGRRSLLDVYHLTTPLYVRPLKVQHRYSPTMDMLHAWEGDEFARHLERRRFRRS